MIIREKTARFELDSVSFTSNARTTIPTPDPFHPTNVPRMPALALEPTSGDCSGSRDVGSLTYGSLVDGRW